jgi:hypothetical protein
VATDFPASEAVVRAARRARQDAKAFIEQGDMDAAADLFEAIEEAESVLRAATALIRQAHRPLSVSGFGETHDRLRDTIDRLSLLGNDDEADGDLEDVQHDEWDEFVEAHPELAADPTFTDDEILEALRAEIDACRHEHLRGAVGTSAVVSRLAPDAQLFRGPRNTPTALVTKTGKTLARLAREGRVVRLRQKWTKGRGRSVWSFAGLELAEWWFKQYELEADDAR